MTTTVFISRAQFIREGMTEFSRMDTLVGTEILDEDEKLDILNKSFDNLKRLGRLSEVVEDGEGSSPV